MSTKQQLAEAMAALPDSLSIEDAVERLYRAFKLKQSATDAGLGGAAADPVPLRPDKDGVLRVGGTRVTLDVVVCAFEDGATAEEIVHRYPTLDLADVYAVIGHYLHHRDEVQAYLRRREQQAEAVRQENLAHFDPRGIRERLLARRDPQR